MRNLLSAGFARLWRSKTLWLSCLFLAGTTVVSVWTRYSNSVRYDYHTNLDHAFVNYVLFLSILIPIVCALFIGTEYADGTIRNKMVCGHSRGSVYLSNLTVCSAASLIMCTAAVAPGLVLGLPLLGGFNMGTTRAVLFFLAAYALSLAWTALITLLSMLISGKIITTSALAMIFSLALLAAGANLEGRLEATPTLQEFAITVNGESIVEEYPNPAYVPEGPARDALQFLVDFTPGGQTLQHSMQRVERSEVMIVYDAVLFVTTTAAGLVLFRRKDIK